MSDTIFILLNKTVVKFEQSNDFYFMEQGKWNQKVLNSALGGLVTNLCDTVFTENHETLQMENEDEYDLKENATKVN